MNNRDTQSSIYKKIAEAEAANLPLWVATVVSSSGSTPVKCGMKMTVDSGGSIAGTIGGGQIEKLTIDRIVKEKPAEPGVWSYDLGIEAGAETSTAMVCGGRMDVLIEPVVSGIPLYIIGGGHCAMALSPLASSIGFSVAVIDNRSVWANNEKHPSARTIVCPDYAQVSALIPDHKNIFIAIMTHGHLHDEAVLRQLIVRDYDYLGMIGSAPKVAQVFKTLAEEGVSREQLSKVYAPIGIDIDSHTPQEVAVSIAAQLIKVRNSLSPAGQKENPASAHDREDGI